MRTAIAIASLAAAVACAADIPAPPWAQRGSGPMSQTEVVAYVSSVLPLLPEDMRATVAAATNAAEANALIYKARLASMMGGRSLPNSRASNPATGSATNVVAELQAAKDTFRLQWPAFYGSNLARFVFSTQSVEQVSRDMALLDELGRRIADKADPLDGLCRYECLFDLHGAAMVVYGKAMALYWHGGARRAEKLFRFLATPTNPNGFTVGSSRYFLGRISRDSLGDTNAAIASFLAVQEQPACLVYTAYAYIEAAEQFVKLRQPDAALGLLAVDVPCIESANLRAARHLMAADMAMDRRDYTNTMRHLQAALLASPAREKDAAVRIARLSFDSAPLWQAVATNLWSGREWLDAIHAGLAVATNTPAPRLYADALLHDWPRIEDIPLGVATNRILNNNIFPQRRRDIAQGGLQLTTSPGTP